jgi:hypothetical protein
MKIYQYCKLQKALLVKINTDLHFMLIKEGNKKFIFYNVLVKFFNKKQTIYFNDYIQCGQIVAVHKKLFLFMFENCFRSIIIYIYKISLKCGKNLNYNIQDL